MEEKARIFRIEVWLNPEIAPTIADIRAKMMRLFEWKRIDKIVRGEIFCQVKRRRELIQFIPSRTSGNQKWNGAIPSFVQSANVIKTFGERIKYTPLKRKKNMELKITREEAIAWIKKYLMAASLLFLLFSKLIIKGIKDIRLISRPIHIPNKEEEEIEIVVPKNRKNK